jgi:lysophospholipase L1-like esterase
MLRVSAGLLAVLLGGVSFVCASEGKPAVQSGLARLTGADTPLKTGTKIAFYGDSITMQGGFITQIEKALAGSERTKKLGVKMFRHGLNGGRVPTVLEGQSPWGKLGGTMQELIDRDRASVIVIYLGVNDVWHGEKGTTRADYEAGLKKMVAMCNKAGTTVVLCTPSVIGEEVNGKNDLNRKLGEYADVVRKVARAEKVTLCDVHEAFVERLAKVNKGNKHAGNLTYDGVHMNQAGNDLLADQVADAIGRALGK